MTQMIPNMSKKSLQINSNKKVNKKKSIRPILIKNEVYPF